MSKVITFSRFFPAYHPRAGEPTYFVEKIHYNIWSQTDDKWMDAQSMVYDLNKHLPRDIVFDFVEFLEMEIDFNDKSKGHTIRSGHRWKVGDWFSPRVWSGKPYRSKMIQFAPDIQVKKVWDFEISLFGIVNEGLVCVDGLPVKNNTIPLIAQNDGLTVEDFSNWFNITKSKPFEGQIICWNENINY